MKKIIVMMMMAQLGWADSFVIEYQYSSEKEQGVVVRYQDKKADVYLGVREKEPVYGMGVYTEESAQSRFGVGVGNEGVYGRMELGGEDGGVSYTHYRNRIIYGVGIRDSNPDFVEPPVTDSPPECNHRSHWCDR